MWTINDEKPNLPFDISVVLSLLFLLVCRLFSMWFIPLNDSTEARYGEIARKMLETGDWVTLFHDYGVPFWAKPPLSSWLSALSMQWFGVNELAVRLPGLLLSIGILGLVYHLVRQRKGSSLALMATLILASSLYFFLDAGTVMTDPALLFSTTLSMVAFWHAITTGHKGWGYAFFVGLGLGLLAKGPIAIVLIGLPLFFWVLTGNVWKLLWQRLPWIKGSCLTLAIALPWYILAEMRTPGFLYYFIVGEHIHRFLTPGWTGDKYGMAHNQHWGMIWAYALAGLFPWSIWAGFWLQKYWKRLPALYQDKDGWLRYLLSFSLLPLCFFTFASNIIYTYVFPVIPAFALLFIELWAKTSTGGRTRYAMLGCSVLTGLLFLLVTLIFAVRPNLVAKTQKPIMDVWKRESPASGSELVYWLYKKDYSAQFYSAGRVKATNNLVTLCGLLSNHVDNYLVVNTEETNQIPLNIMSHCSPIKASVLQGGKAILYHCGILDCS